MLRLIMNIILALTSIICGTVVFYLSETFTRRNIQHVEGAYTVPFETHGGIVYVSTNESVLDKAFWVAFLLSFFVLFAFNLMRKRS